MPDDNLCMNFEKMLMVEGDFFQELKDGSEYDYLINLIQARGFLVEKNDRGLFMSDNSHSKDAAFLDQLLRQFSLGYIQDNQICILPDFSASEFETAFKDKKQISGDVSIPNYDWEYCKRRKHGHKVPVEWLEPFIARYVKAISACGVLTVGSCDGNHPGCHNVFLQLSGRPTTVWHQLICREFLQDKYNLAWNKNCTEIHFSEKNRYNVYAELNRAAANLYKNRKVLRQVKQNAFSRMTASFMKRAEPDEIEILFTENAKKEFAALVLPQ